MANDDLLRAMVQTIRRYEKGELSLADTQAAIEANASALEGVSADLRAELREIDEDLEHIQHAMPLDEQPSAAVVRVPPPELLPRLLLPLWRCPNQAGRGWSGSTPQWSCRRRWDPASPEPSPRKPLGQDH